MAVTVVVGAGPVSAPVACGLVACAATGRKLDATNGAVPAVAAGLDAGKATAAAVTVAAVGGVVLLVAVVAAGIDVAGLTAGLMPAAASAEEATDDEPLATPDKFNTRIVFALTGAGAIVGVCTVRFV